MKNNSERVPNKNFKLLMHDLSIPIQNQQKYVYNSLVKFRLSRYFDRLNSLGYATVDNFLRILFPEGLNIAEDKNVSHNVEDTKEFKLLSYNLGMFKDEKIRFKQSIIYVKNIVLNHVHKKKLFQKEIHESKIKKQKHEIKKQPDFENHQKRNFGKSTIFSASPKTIKFSI